MKLLLQCGDVNLDSPDNEASTPKVRKEPGGS